MPGCNGFPPGGRRPDAAAHDLAAIAGGSKSRLLSNGVLDYDFYRARAEYLRREHMAQAGSRARQAVRALVVRLAKRIAAPTDKPTPDITPARRC